MSTDRDEDTCEARHYACCDMMPPPAAPVSEGVYAAWYERHVAAYRQHLADRKSSDA